MAEINPELFKHILFYHLLYFIVGGIFIREQNLNQDKIYQEILKSNSKKEKKGNKK